MISLLCIGRSVVQQSQLNVSGFKIFLKIKEIHRNGRGRRARHFESFHKELDADNDGSLSIAELEQACSRMGMSTCSLALEQFRKVWVERSGGRARSRLSYRTYF